MEREAAAQVELKSEALHGEGPAERGSCESFSHRRAEERPSVVSSHFMETGDESAIMHTVPSVDLTREQYDAVARTVPGGEKNVQSIYPLSPVQEGMLFHNLLNESSDTYLLSTLFELAGTTVLRAFIDAIQRVIDRHETLRTAVLWDNLPRPVQVVYRSAILPVEDMVLSQDGDLMEQIRERMKPQHQKLDLTRAPLLRLLVTAGHQDGSYYALLQVHHMMFDYQARKSMVAEIMAYLDHKEQELPIPTPYAQYMIKMLAQTETQGAKQFFERKLGDVSEPTAPFGLLNIHGDGSRLEEDVRELEPILIQRVRALPWRSARLFHAAWALVVAHTSGRDDIVFGTVLSMRRRFGQGQYVLGTSINTLPLRLRLQGITAKELMEQTHEELEDLLKHAAVPLTLAQQCSAVTAGAPLFTSLMNYRRSVVAAEATNASGARLVAHHVNWTNYPITIQVDDFGERIAVLAQTDRYVDPRRIIGYLQAAMYSLVDALERVPNAPALALSILPDGERKQIVDLFNATQASYPTHKLVHELFEEQVQHTPRAVAIVCGNQRLTYEELNCRANKLAHLLMARGVRPDSRVALYAERSVEVIVGLLGILKAGGAYVPLDASYPLKRLRYMIEDSAPTVLLTQQILRRSLPMEESRVIYLDADDDETGSGCAENPDPVRLGLRSQHLAYVIYTSGSTGAPKGVMVEHRNLANLVHWHCATFDVRAGICSSSVAALGFDAATWEIWPPLSVGAMLVLAPTEVAGDAEKLTTWWSNQSLDVSFLPTPMAEFVFSRNLINSQLRTLLVGGDRLRYRPASTSFKLINNYGPTETAVVATSGEIHGDDGSLHIGRPIANTQIYILDERRQVVPLGVAGEIYVGGAGVARGYLNRAELTTERFVADPFNVDSRARLYRTGDLGRWRTDGTIEYMGRNDHQVKIRGYRIELGEIEAQLVRHPKVEDAVVTARRDAAGETRLVAYFTQRDSVGLGAEELRIHMKAMLPEYMVPAAFVKLERLPLTPNGKLNLSALPAPELLAFAVRQYDPPQGRIEERLVHIWQELLQVSKVGRQDSFFELGGHSLLAVKSLFHINQAFECSLRVVDIYKSPTLRDLAARIGGSAIHDDLIDLSKEGVLEQSIVAVPGLRSTQRHRILLTGATGFVGRFLLVQLLEDTSATLYCIVRGQSEQQAFSRLKSTLSKWNLWRLGFERRIVAIPGDLSQPRLGIDETTYQLLSQKIDCIYHCATSMNHLESYAMAKPTNVGATRELIKLAAIHRPKVINYISTLSIFRSSGTDAVRVVDETTPIDGEQHLSSSGYVASKWVGEKLIMTASDRGIPCNIFRVGLVWADAQQGRYDELQQGYRVFKSCLLSGFGIENYRYPMAPTPVDFVARAIVCLADRHRDGQDIFHISSTGQAIDGIFERCNEIAGTSLQLLPYYDWICEMKKLHQAGRSLPAVPLIEFAFSMNEVAFYEHHRSHPAANIRFDCMRTQQELEHVGIATPELDDDMLKVYVDRMLSRDPDLQGGQVSEDYHRPASPTDFSSYLSTNGRSV
jgi:amino acid adenylation domain-containing protein/thioester reductase-like protein